MPARTLLHWLIRFLYTQCPITPGIFKNTFLLILIALDHRSFKSILKKGQYHNTFQSASFLISYNKEIPSITDFITRASFLGRNLDIKNDFTVFQQEDRE